MLCVGAALEVKPEHRFVLSSALHLDLVLDFSWTGSSTGCDSLEAKTLTRPAGTRALDPALRATFVLHPHIAAP